MSFSMINPSTEFEVPKKLLYYTIIISYHIPHVIASFIFMSGGTNIAWSVGFRNILLTIMSAKHTLVAWFIGGIIGAILSCFLANKVPKRMVLVSLNFVGICLT